MGDQEKILLPNRFDYSYHKEFQAHCEECIKSPLVKCIVLDFSRVEYIDSAALGMMMMWNKRAVAENKKMAIKGAKGMTQQILEMANMKKIFECIQ